MIDASDSGRESSDGLIYKFMNDTSSGIRVDSSGRRYHRPRKVEFETIRINETDLHRGGWKGYDNLAFLDWDSNPSHDTIRKYSFEASERFLTYWFEVFDVVVARSLAGKGREIFQKPFIVPDIFFDTGIPVTSEHSSVPPGMHAKIIEEYGRSISCKCEKRIFYISEYLNNITADVIECLKPYSLLWDLRKLRDTAIREPGNILTLLKSDLQLKIKNRMLSRHIEDLLSAHAAVQFNNILAQRKELSVKSDSLRNLISNHKKGNTVSFSTNSLKLIFESTSEISFPAEITALYLWYMYPEKLYAAARSAFLNLSSAHRLKIRLEKLNYLHARYKTEADAESLRNRIARHEKTASLKAEMLGPEKIKDINNIFIKFNTVHALDLYFKLIIENTNTDTDLIKIWNQTTGKLHTAELKFLSADAFSLLSRYYEAYQNLKITDQKIIEFYKDACSAAMKNFSRTDFSDELSIKHETPHDNRYFGLEKIEIDPSWISGNPFQEKEFVESARSLIFKRLRPLRMSASHYSLIPGHRHGAMTLNPVMRLWKDKVYPKKKEDPALAGMELNTKETIFCLLRLAELVDTKLPEREIVRGKISELKHLKENIETMTLFLIPGSCFPIREIQRQNFPEFRNKVIGESRNPVELGVHPSEDSILTGAWYQKNNHTLYYPVGGDNGMLIRNIWNSARISGPPAFYFALGQFVHDTLQDHEIYYRRDEKTFRNCIEDYYRFEDNLRKNRGEKTGRKKKDNSRAAVRFMFAVYYSRLMTEALTGTSQSQFRHIPSEDWLHAKLSIPLLSKTPKDHFRKIRNEVRNIILNSA